MWVQERRYGNPRPEALQAEAEAVISRCREAYDRIAALPPDRVNHQTVVKVLASADREYLNGYFRCRFPADVSLDRETRQISSQMDKKLADFQIELNLRKDVYEKLVTFHSLSAGDASLSPETRRYIERKIKLGKRNGLHLPEESRIKLKDIQIRLNELAVEYSSTLSEDDTRLEVDENQLGGMTPAFIASLEKSGDSSYWVTMSYPHVFPILRECANSETRRRVCEAFYSRCVESNIPVLEEVIRLRQERATLLGYSNHAAYRSELCMSRTPEAITEFLSDLEEKLKPLWEMEKQQLIERKKEENPNEAEVLNHWDISYYANERRKKLYAVDQNLIKEYFPCDVVTQGMFRIYEKMLQLQISEIKPADAWHPDVRLFHVTDTANTNATLGYFYMDLHPREGKLTHACNRILQIGCVNDEDNRGPAIATLICNFSKPTQDKPSLLDHKEVQTYFHEFGHMMHFMCSQAEYSIFNSFLVELDFLEAPSQMLENWVWQAEPLRLLSGFYQDVTKPLPDQLIEQLIRSRKANVAAETLRQVALSIFAHKLTLSGDASPRQLFKDLYEKLIGISPVGSMPANWVHMTDPLYEGVYYVYLWSEVYSFDMFETKFQVEGLTNAETGQQYRELILQPGGGMDAECMLLKFLGRPPQKDAFYRYLGIEVS